MELIANDMPESFIVSMKYPLKISCIIPTLNEYLTIRQVIRDVKCYVDEVIVVDGHSTDGTFETASKEGAHVFLQSGKGKGAALREAFTRVTGDIVIMMDGDGSMKAEEIPRFIDAILSGADVVKGSRFRKNGGSDDLTPFRKMGNFLLMQIVNLFWNTRYTDLCYGFNAFRKEALDKLKNYLNSNAFEIETEICIKSHKMGLQVVEVPSKEHKRTHGRSHLSAFSDGLSILKIIMRELFSNPEFV